MRAFAAALGFNWCRAGGADMQSFPAASLGTTNVEAAPTTAAAEEYWRTVRLARRNEAQRQAQMTALLTQQAHEHQTIRQAMSLCALRD
jgi:hypothetical protein